MSERTNNPERIYLEPPPYSPEGRQWCADDVRESVRQAVEWGIEDAWPRYNRIYDPHDPDDESRQEWVDCITEQVVTALLRTPRGEGEASGKGARDVGYMLGMLHAAEHVFGHGKGIIAAELVSEIMDGFGVRRVKELACEQDVSICWKEVDVFRAARRGEGGGE